MAEIATRPGETLTQKHARLEGEPLTAPERAFMEAESDADFARRQWESSDKSTPASKMLYDRWERARALLDRTVELLD